MGIENACCNDSSAHPDFRSDPMSHTMKLSRRDPVNIENLIEEQANYMDNLTEHETVDTTQSSTTH